MSTAEPALRFGLHLGSLHPGAWVAVAEEADRLGFESIWIPEHLVIPLHSEGSPYDGEEHPPLPATTPIFDAFGVLCYLAARTQRIRLGTHVYNIGLRHPFVTARGATTLDVLSGGRLELGIGASWLRSEWDALGLDFDSRGQRVDEALEVCRRLWSEGTTEHHGRWFDFGPVAFEPKPVQPGGPPLQIGGHGPAALRRVATVGAGWMPMDHSLDALPAALETIRLNAERCGRAASIQLTMFGEVTGREDIDRYVSAGVTRLIVRPWARSRDAVDSIRTFADQPWFGVARAVHDDL